MKNGDKKGLDIENEIEQFCQGTEEVLTKIHERIDEEQTQKQQKKKKTPALATSE
jgi:hypothetical protein